MSPLLGARRSLLSRRPVVAAGGGGGISAPTDVAGCQLWLDAPYLALADGAAVAMFTDRSGNGRDFAQATAGAKPTYKTAIKNGLAVVRFDGIGDYMDAAANLSTMITTSASTVVAVFSATAINTNAAQTYLNDAILSESVAGNYQLILKSAPTVGLAYDPTVAAATIATGTWYVVVGKHDGVNLSTYVNGAAAVTAAKGTGAAVANPARVGASYNAANLFDGDLGELIVYNVALSDADRDAVESYCGARWGITVA